MPVKDIEMAYQDRYTFAPLSKAAEKPVQWYILRPRFIKAAGDSLAFIGRAFHDMSKKTRFIDTFTEYVDRIDRSALIHIIRLLHLLHMEIIF